MSERMRRYLPTLRRIHRLGDNAKRQLIKNCDRQLIECFCECSKNILKGNVPLKPAQLRKSRREKQSLRALALKKTSLKKKRKILQKGGFLGALLTPALSILGNIIAGFATRDGT
jgi:hypothetical protein